MKVDIDKVRFIDLPKMLDERGNLSFLEEKKHIPFEIVRSYWIYDVPGGETRGGHSYIKNEEFVIALSGSFDVVVNNGDTKKTFTLNRSYYGLYIPNGIWRHMENFSTNSLAYIIASTSYDKQDYVQDHEQYIIGR